MCEGFIAAKEVHHFHLVSLPGIHCFQGREELIHSNVHLNYLELFARSRTKAHFTRRLAIKRSRRCWKSAPFALDWAQRSPPCNTTNIMCLEFSRSEGCSRASKSTAHDRV